MSRSEQKVLQYLEEAHASEIGLTRTLQSQILMTSRGRYRSALESHLKQTREHARRLERRMSELGRDQEPLQVVVAFAENTLSQVLALSKTPLDLIRGSGGEEKVLKNAKDACATEALEIATYSALEHLAKSVGDEDTASLAASIRAEEESMLDRVLREIPNLVEAVLGAEVNGKGSYDLTKTGAADAARELGARTKRTASKAESQAKRGARKARKVPGVARAEGQVKGALASQRDLAIAAYDKRTANEILEKLSGLSQVELAKVEAYERKNQARSTVLSRISVLRASEPWPGYDELNVEEIRAELSGADRRRASAVRSYERAHKSRASVLQAAERERASA